MQRCRGTVQCLQSAPYTNEVKSCRVDTRGELVSTVIYGAGPLEPCAQGCLGKLASQLGQTLPDN